MMRSRDTTSFLPRVGCDQRGAALAMALFLVLIFSGLCVYALDLTRMEIPVAVKQRDQLQAMYVAEAGTEQAYASLRAALTAGAADFDAVLQSNGGYLDLDADGAAGTVMVGGVPTPLFENFTIGGVLVGQYRVQVVNNRNDTGATYVTGTAFTVPATTVQSAGGATDDTDKIVYMLSTGQVTAGGVTSVRQIETRVAPTGLPAFLAGCGTNSNPGLTISGNPMIAGSQGSVHTNCNATLNGNPSISQKLTSSGTNTISGGSTTVGGQTVAVATAAGDIKNNQPIIPIPPITPTDYRTSTYLRSDAQALLDNPSGGSTQGDYILRVETDFSAAIRRITSWTPPTTTTTTAAGTGPAGTTTTTTTTATAAGAAGTSGTTTMTTTTTVMTMTTTTTTTMTTTANTVTVSSGGAGASIDYPSEGGGSWKFTGGSSGIWDWQGNTVPGKLRDRAFYFERGDPTQNVLTGSVKVGSNPGSNATPWGATIIADGHIDISGNPTMQTSGHSGNIQLVAGTDVQLGGTVTSTPATGGIIAAREQIQINGNGSFVGLFVAQDAANTDPFVNATTINGNPSITYNGAPPPPSTWNLPLVRTSWRQIQ